MAGVSAKRTSGAHRAYCRFPLSSSMELSRSTSSCLYTSSQATLRRSKSRLSMTLHERSRSPSAKNKLPEAFYLDQMSSRPDDEKRQLMRQLEDQVADLSLYLEEERLQHRETRHQAEQALQEKVKQLMTCHQVAMKGLQEEHRTEQQLQQELHKQELLDLKTESNSIIAAQKSELEILNGAFYAFKVQTNIEQKKAIKQLAQELSDRYGKDKLEAVTSAESKLRDECERMRTKLEKECEEKVAAMKRKQRRELASMVHKVSNHEHDLRKMEELNEQVKALRKQLVQMEQKYRDTDTQLKSSKAAGHELRIRLAASERESGTHVSENESFYKEQVDKLLAENNALRFRYLKKCEQLFYANHGHGEGDVVLTSAEPEMISVGGIHKYRAAERLPKRNNQLQLKICDLTADLPETLDRTKPIREPMTLHTPKLLPCALPSAHMLLTDE